MSGDMLPLFTALLIGAVVALLMVIAVILLPRVIRTRALTTSFYCQWAQRNVVLRYLAYEARHPVGVISCTAFADPTIVTCGKQCLAGDGPAGLAAEEQKKSTALGD